MRFRPLDVTLGLLLAALPLTLPSGLPAWLRLVVALVVAAAATAATSRDIGRTPVAVGLVAWLGISIAGAAGEGPGATVGVVGGLLLRLWCGLPELRTIGRPVLPDLAPELLGGAAAAALVLAVAEVRGGLPPAVLIAALAAAAVLVAAGLTRVRR